MTIWTEPRHRLRYPSEHVVRFLSALEPGRMLDIGAGFGRHLRLGEELGFDVTGTDYWPVLDGVVRAPMDKLPFPDETFDVALAYGVFYYGIRPQHQQAINEMHRVLRHDGAGFVCVRSTGDWRFAGITEADDEFGMEMDFITVEDIPTLYGQFSDFHIELSQWTENDCARTNADYLIAVTK